MDVELERQNYVRLSGTLVGDVMERALADGVVVSSFRINVRRESQKQGNAASDTIDCVATPARLRRSLAKFTSGSGIEVEGRLHRRYFRAGGSLVSRYEVDVCSLTRTAAADHMRR
jgi:single-strand DNA-binding protein